MKPIVEQSTVERTGIAPENESSFTIEDSPEMFEILSSGIYTDGIAAPVRELACNAYDAHVDAGRADIPFTIHLPNPIEPWFSVSDEGIGLCDEMIHTLYTRYGKTTKNESNLVIGSKGLGSKSPLAYAETFDVISRFNGLRQVYSVYLNEDNRPMITKMGNPVATDEHNGLEVRIVVQSSDFQRFADATGRLLKYFPVKPIVVGRANFQFDELPKNRFEGDGYFTSVGDRYSSDKFTAVMGHVPYRVDMDKLEDELTGSEVEFLAQYKVVAFFELGELDTAASREEIKYKKVCVANLVKKIQTARVDFLKRTDDELVKGLTAGTTGRWDAYLELSAKFDNMRRLTSIAGDYVWSADIVTEWIDDDGSIDFMTPDYHKMVCYRKGKVRAVRTKDYTNNSVPHTATLKPTMHFDTVVLIDVRTRSSLRLNQYLASVGRHENIITITPTSEKIINERQPNLKTIDYKTDYDNLLEAIGNPKVVNLSEVSKDVTITRNGKRIPGLTFNKFQAGWSPSNSHTRRVGWDIVEAPAAGEERLYLLIETLSKKMSIRNGDTLGWSQGSAKDKVGQMLTVINAVKGTEYKASELYGLTKKVVKHIKDDPEWTNIFDLYEECALEMLHVYEYFANKAATESSHGIKDMVFDERFPQLCERYLEEDSILRTTFMDYHLTDRAMQMELKKLNEDSMRSIRFLGREVQLDGFGDIADPVPLFNYRVLVKQYPMLDAISCSIMSRRETIFQYFADTDAK